MRARPGCGPARRCRASPSVAPSSVDTTFAPIWSLIVSSGPAPISPASGAGSAIARCAASCLAEKRRSSDPPKCAKRGSVPIRSTDRWPVRSDHVRLLLEHRQRDPHSGQAPHLFQQPFVEAVGAPRVELELRVADDLAGELGDRAGEARARDLGGEQQRHADRDPEDREALLYEHRTCAQPRAVEPEDVREAHPRHPYTSSRGEALGWEGHPARDRAVLLQAPVAQLVYLVGERGGLAGRAWRARSPRRAPGRARAAAPALRGCAACRAFPVGSSASTSFGSVASAIAISTRWRSPIESCSVRCSIRSPRPSRSSSGSIVSPAWRLLESHSFNEAFSIARAPGIRL